MPPGDKLTPKEAIYDTRERLVRMETVLIGVPDTDDKGLVGTVKDNTDNLDTTRKKVGKLEIRIWILIAFLIGSGVVSGAAAFQLMTAP